MTTKLFPARCACDVPQHTALNLFWCPMCSDTMFRLFICFCGFFPRLGVGHFCPFLCQTVLAFASQPGMTTGCKWACVAEHHCTARASSSKGTPGHCMEHSQSRGKVVYFPVERLSLMVENVLGNPESSITGGNQPGCV